MFVDYFLCPICEKDDDETFVTAPWRQTGPFFVRKLTCDKGHEFLETEATSHGSY